jgi:hypothetical protein
MEGAAIPLRTAAAHTAVVHPLAGGRRDVVAAAGRFFS